MLAAPEVCFSVVQLFWTCQFWVLLSEHHAADSGDQPSHPHM